MNRHPINYRYIGKAPNILHRQIGLFRDDRQFALEILWILGGIQPIDRTPKRQQGQHDRSSVSYSHLGAAPDRFPIFITPSTLQKRSTNCANRRDRKSGRKSISRQLHLLYLSDTCPGKETFRYCLWDRVFPPLDIAPVLSAGKTPMVDRTAPCAFSIGPRKEHRFEAPLRNRCSLIPHIINHIRSQINMTPFESSGHRALFRLKYIHIYKDNVSLGFLSLGNYFFHLCWVSIFEKI